MLAEVNASLALSMLLMVKEYLKVAYGITSERIAAFHPNQSEKRKVEERMMVARNNNVPLMLSKLNLNASLEPADLSALYKVSICFTMLLLPLCHPYAPDVLALLSDMLLCRTEMRCAFRRL